MFNNFNIYKKKIFVLELYLFINMNKCNIFYFIVFVKGRSLVELFIVK